jgi:hypothetical protein
MKRTICHFCKRTIPSDDPHFGMGIGHERCELRAARKARNDYVGRWSDNLVSSIRDLLSVLQFARSLEKALNTFSRMRRDSKGRFTRRMDRV